MRFQSTLPLRRATGHHGTRGTRRTISIHAPLAESDHAEYANVLDHLHFNPRSPCGERRKYVANFDAMRSFQSTLPLRRATRGGMLTVMDVAHFNPRSPCGERRWDIGLYDSSHNFKPRSPCGERPKVTSGSEQSLLFQSTLPLRRATRCTGVSPEPGRHFNPRSPCGERL